MSEQGVFVIAEAGVNHNGSYELACQLVDAAKEAGADAVKFQTFKAEKLVSHNMKQADYQVQNTGKKQSQLHMLKALEQTQDEQENLKKYCDKKNILFMSSPFDVESANWLIDELKVSPMKVGSGEITNGPMLLEIARSGTKVILSTGMSTLSDIENALAVLSFGYLTGDRSFSLEEGFKCMISEEGQKTLGEKVSLLHCTTEYPAPFEDANLRAMETLGRCFPVSIGYSDHTQGITVPIAAVALGAKVIEKHFTLSRQMEGPDHKASLEPGELKEMVESIRVVEQSLGNTWKFPRESELKNIFIARKCLVAKKPIKKGEKFSVENLDAKRAGKGLSPMKFWDVCGVVADKDYNVDDLIQI